MKIKDITLKGIIDEDFVNYKVPSMTLMFPNCSLKCDKECGQPVCQNSSLINEPDITVDIESLIQRYLNNPITEAIVMQGMEPLDSFKELEQFIYLLRTRYKCNDTVVIYTGYKNHEVLDKCINLAFMGNVIVKFGRFIPNQQKHFDEVLGVYLSSDNQYAEKLV